MKSFICIACQKSFTTGRSLKRHIKSFCKKRVNTKQPTFHIQFTPTFDEMLLAVRGYPPVGLQAQKFLLEEYFSNFQQYIKNVSKGLTIRVIAKFEYINRENTRLFEIVEINRVSTDKTASTPKQWYLNHIVKPVEAKMKEIEEGGNAIVLHMCYFKGYVENQQPLRNEGEKYSQTVQINNSVYSMDEDCNLAFQQAKEEEVPGFRNV